MSQKLTIIFDLDGTLVETAPDLISAHNHVMSKYGFASKKSEDIKKLVGKGANSLITRSVWGQAQDNFRKIDDQALKKEMVSEFLDYYTKHSVLPRYWLRMPESKPAHCDWHKRCFVWQTSSPPMPIRIRVSRLASLEQSNAT